MVGSWEHLAEIFVVQNPIPWHVAETRQHCCDKRTDRPSIWGQSIYSYRLESPAPASPPRSINHHCTCLSHDTISTTSSSCKPPRWPCAAHAASLGVHAGTRRRRIGRRHVMAAPAAVPSPRAPTPSTRSATEPPLRLPHAGYSEIRVAPPSAPN